MVKIYNYPRWLTVLYPGSIWGFFRSKRKVLFLTFDDGPSRESTSWILQELDKYSAKATFFCLGSQVNKFPSLLPRMIADGHTVGNHSMTHPRGWRTNNAKYVENVLEAKKVIDSKLFRPPYGNLKFSQHKALRKLGFTSVFWSFVTYDFVRNIDSEKVLKKMKRSVKSGDIVVFHDSTKAFPQLKQILPETLKYYSEKGYKFDALDRD